MRSERVNQGFYVKAENDTGLLSLAVKQGTSGKLGEKIMDPPLKKVRAQLINIENSDNFSLTALVSFNETYIQSKGGVKEGEIRKSVAEEYSSNNPDRQIMKGDRIFIIRGQQGTVFRLEPEYPHIKLTTGELKNNYITGEPIFDAELSKEEDINDIVTDFADVLETTVDMSYKVYELTPPDSKFMLHHPALNMSVEECVYLLEDL